MICSPWFWNAKNCVLGGRFWLEKIDRNCVIADLEQASWFWRNTWFSGEPKLQTLLRKELYFFKSLLGYSFGGSKNCWDSVFFSTVYSGILLGGQKLLRQCSFSNSLLRFSVGRPKTAETVFFFLSYSCLGFVCMVCTYIGLGTFGYVANL